MFTSSKSKYHVFVEPFPSSKPNNNKYNIYDFNLPISNDVKEKDKPVKQILREMKLLFFDYLESSTSVPANGIHLTDPVDSEDNNLRELIRIVKKTVQHIIGEDEERMPPFPFESPTNTSDYSMQSGTWDAGYITIYKESKTKEEINPLVAKEEIFFPLGKCYSSLGGIYKLELKNCGSRKGLGIVNTSPFPIQKDILLGRYKGRKLSKNHKKFIDLKYSNEEYIFQVNAEYCVDAGSALDGNWTRYMNHSNKREPQSNVKVRIIKRDTSIADNEDDGTGEMLFLEDGTFRIITESMLYEEDDDCSEVVAFYSSRDILVGEELNFDYGEEYESWMAEH